MLHGMSQKIKLENVNGPKHNMSAWYSIRLLLSSGVGILIIFSGKKIHFLTAHQLLTYFCRQCITPTNAEATFVQSTRMQIFLKII